MDTPALDDASDQIHGLTGQQVELAKKEPGPKTYEGLFGRVQRGRLGDLNGRVLDDDQVVGQVAGPV